MKRLVLAACLSASGLAFGQTGDGGFQPIFDDPNPHVFVINDFTAQVTGAGRLEAAQAVPTVLDADAMLYGEPAIVTVEEGGVRLPDKQFSLPPE